MCFDIFELFQDEYEDLKRRILKALETQEVPLDSICLDGNDGFAHISSDIRNHSSVVKVMKITQQEELLKMINL
jgi:hypothetical protein